jgi:hypothetical protein
VSDKQVYLSDEDSTSIKALYARARVLREKGDREGARALRRMGMQILNGSMIENLEADIIHDDESLMYSDLYGTDTGMSQEDFRADRRHVEINLIKGSSLYNDVLALLKNDFMKPKEV